MNLPLPATQVPSEILSLETRSAGYSMVTFMNFIMTFVVGQSFLSMLCAFRVSNQRQTSPVTLFTAWVPTAVAAPFLVAERCKNVIASLNGCCAVPTTARSPVCISPLLIRAFTWWGTVWHLPVLRGLGDPDDPLRHAPGAGDEEHPPGACCPPPACPSTCPVFIWCACY